MVILIVSVYLKCCIRVVLPFMKNYSGSGEFTKASRLLEAIRIVFINSLLVLLLGGALWGYLRYSGKIER